MSNEQRSAFRIQMPDGQKGASLRIDGRKFEVQLIDASASGVAVACPVHCPIEVGHSCELHTASGGGVIRIVRKEVFSDGILLGAVRTGDLAVGPGGLLGRVQEAAALPIQLVSGCNLPTRIGAYTVAVAAVIGGFIYAYPRMVHQSPNASEHTPAALDQAPTTTIAEQTPSPAEVQAALRKLEAALPSLAPELSESDKRARRIFDRQRQLLAPEIAQKLRLTPTQESRIQRALAPAEEVADDIQNPQFWEAIRQAETQILGILTPAQIKAWRQQSGT